MLLQNAESGDHQVGITIPMAVYNGARFLDRSIKSVLNQTSSDWELICIDDGSTDNSSDIIKKYAELDERITYIYQENAGPARARQNGYRRSRGKYVFTGFDQDDVLDVNFVQNLWDEAIESEADVVLCDWLLEQENGEFVSFGKAHGLEIGRTLSGREGFEMTFPWRIHGIGLWKQWLVRTIAVDDVHAFNSYDADEFLGRVIFLAANRIKVGSGKYYHLRNPDSITTKPSLRRLQSLDTNERLVSLARQNGFPETVVWKVLLYQRQYFKVLFKMLPQCKGNSADEIAQAQTLINSHFCSFKKDIRETYRSAIKNRFQAELLLAKLQVKRLVMRLTLKLKNNP